MVVSEWLGSLTHDGESCNATNFNTTTMTLVEDDDDDAARTHLPHAIMPRSRADALIAVSLCIQKYAHNKNKDPVTGKPILSYLKIPTWWLGILLNVAGEVGNMLSYGLAPAAVVAPVGSVGVVVNEIIAVLFLELLRYRDLLGLVLVISGIVMVIFAVPESDEKLSVHHLLSREIYFTRARTGTSLLSYASSSSSATSSRGTRRSASSSGSSSARPSAR